jgi:hypothetical protein
VEELSRKTVPHILPKNYTPPELLELVKKSIETAEK